MPRQLRLTAKSVARLRVPDPSGKQVVYWDSGYIGALPGFGVLVSATTKSFMVQRDMPGGRTVRINLGRTNLLTFDDARLKAKDYLLKLESGVDPRAVAKAAVDANITLRVALNNYLTGKKSLRESSKAGFRWCFERFLRDWLDRPLISITRDMVDHRHETIAEKIAARGRHSGAATANGTMRGLRAVWNWEARTNDALPRNPVRLTDRWHQLNKRTRYVRSDQLPPFYEAVKALPNPVQRDYLLLLLFTGLRRREASTLKWDDHIDLPGKVIRIPAVRMKKGRKLDLPMSSFVSEMLEARRKLGKEAFVFPANSKSRHIEEPKFALRLIANASGIRVSCHDLRRSYITVARNTTGVSAAHAKALVAHAVGGDVTEDYDMTTSEELREPAQRIADRIQMLCEPSSAKVIKLAARRRR